jgi:hypothetical protein
MNLERLAALAVSMAWLAAGTADATAQPRLGSGVAPSGPINTLKELHDAYFACIRMPPPELSQPGIEITIRFSVNKSGEVLGEPRFTFLTPNVVVEKRAAYQRAMADALNLCSPFPLTESFGGAVAGRPQALRISDTRGQRKA